VAQLDALQAIATVCLIADSIQKQVNQFGTLGGIPFRPINACNGLPKDGVVLPFRPVVACTGLPKDDLPLHTVVACNGLPKDAVVCAFSRLLPTPVYPKTKLFGLKRWPKGPERALSMVRLDVHQNSMRHVA
jgi:hypothetical protein